MATTMLLPARNLTAVVVDISRRDDQRVGKESRPGAGAAAQHRRALRRRSASRFQQQRCHQPNPVAMPNWTQGAGDPYLRSYSANNVGNKNNGLRGDVLLSWFKPLDESFDGDAYSSSFSAEPAAPAANVAINNGATLRFNASSITLGENRSIALGTGGGVIDTNGNTAAIAGVVSGTTFTKSGGGRCYGRAQTRTAAGRRSPAARFRYVCHIASKMSRGDGAIDLAILRSRAGNDVGDVHRNCYAVQPPTVPGVENSCTQETRRQPTPLMTSKFVSETHVEIVAGRSHVSVTSESAAALYCQCAWRQPIFSSKRGPIRQEFASCSTLPIHSAIITATNQSAVRVRAVFRAFNGGVR